MISARINAGGRWGHEFARRVNRQVPRLVEQASEDGARTAAAKAGSRRRTGLMAEMETLPVKGTPTGWTGGFRSKAWYAGFQSRGTRSGVTPLGFLEDGAKEAKASLRRRLDRL